MNEATRQRDEDLAKLIEQSRKLGPMTSEEQREQRISWVYGNCKLSNPDVTRETVENAVDGGLSPPPYHNPLAALRRERKVKSGWAAKLLGISRQRLHVVEHATKPLRCMGRLLAKAAEVWPVVDETAVKATPRKESK